MTANPLQRRAQQSILSLLNSIEGVRLEREALKDRRYQPEPIIHNIDNYVRAQTETLAWLDASGFPATFAALRLVVRNLENDPPFLEAVQRLGIPHLAVSLDQGCFEVHFQETVPPQGG